MSKVICYYHKVDLDGKCAAAIVRRKYPECELIGVDYPDKPDFEKIEPGDTIIVVDFSFIPYEMDLLYGYGSDKDNRGRHQGKDLIWIDHHKSAINESALGWYYRCAGKRDITKAACELAWEYFFPDKEMPEAVRLLGRYDVWDHKDENVLPFQYGIQLYNTDPDEIRWEDWMGNDPGLWLTISNICKTGEELIKYERIQSAIYSKSRAYPVEFEGHKAWAINKALGNSKIFETIPNANKRPLWILFSYKAGIWKYSLRRAPNSGIDISKIVVKYRGGGHAGDASFTSDKYLLDDM